MHLSEERVEQQVHRPHGSVHTARSIAFQGLNGRVIGLKDPKLEVQVAVAEVQVVIAADGDQELLGVHLSPDPAGAHQVVIDDAYLYGWHVFHVQFALGARHTGLLCVGWK